MIVDTKQSNLSEQSNLSLRPDKKAPELRHAVDYISICLTINSASQNLFYRLLHNCCTSTDSQ